MNLHTHKNEFAWNTQFNIFKNTILIEHLFVIVYTPIDQNFRTVYSDLFCIRWVFFLFFRWIIFLFGNKHALQS